ncbi:glycerol-3-phosphate acyltransferase [Lysinibacillus sp. M3]|uniref:Glycerol-3-phosphate acyltransferase n=1 Tax=Lysinibacillus zambalensis TaxID=3160866 RepID=A0ABV1MW65_9BACI
MTVYFVGKVYGVKLQEERSKNIGARNAGSMIGKDAFIWTFLGGTLKGALIVLPTKFDSVCITSSTC